MIKIGNDQPDLLAFVTESSKEMGREVSELAIYQFLVVYQMFQEACGKIKQISSEEIIECYQNNEGLMERLERAYERFLDRIASLQTSKQPHVVNYVVDALMEDKPFSGARIIYTLVVFLVFLGIMFLLWKILNPLVGRYFS